MPKNDVHITLEGTAGSLVIRAGFTHQGGIEALFGPSGAGKTSLLRMIAGLDHPASGFIGPKDSPWFDDKTGICQPAHKRPVTLMAQGSDLFPTMTVADNLAFAIRRAPDRRLDEASVIEAMALAPLLDRLPDKLSGGETKRVALARALLAQPGLLLLDEPLAGLDTARKRDLLGFIERAAKQFDIAILFVSHDIAEVSQLARRVHLMDAGRVTASGPATEILSSTRADLLSGHFEAGSLIDGQIASFDPDDQMASATIGDHRLDLPSPRPLTPGTTIRLRIRARDVAIALSKPQDISIRNCLPAKITHIDAPTDGPFVECTLSLSPAISLRARVTKRTVRELDLERHMSDETLVFALIKAVSFDRRMTPTI